MSAPSSSDSAGVVEAAAERQPHRRRGHPPLLPLGGPDHHAQDRYDVDLQEFQQLAREQIIFGCHVHVGIADREEAIQVMNRARPWLPR